MARPGLGALPCPTARPWGVRPGPTTRWLWVRGVWAWGAVSNTTARALASCRCALWGGARGCLEGAPLACVWGVRGWALCHAQFCELTVCAAGGRARGRPESAPLACLWGVRGWALSHARRCELTVRAVGAARGRPGGGGGGSACVWGVRGWALSHARAPVLGACSRGPLPTGCCCGGGGPGDPPPIQMRELLRAGFARCGAARGRPVGGVS